MMKKLRILILLIFSFLLTSCQYKQEIRYSYLYRNDNYISEINNYEIISSEYLLNKYKYDESYINAEVLDKYNSYFFAFNSLIYFEVSYNSGLGNSVIVSYSLNENTLNINLRRFLKLYDYDVVTKDIYVLEINKYVANKIDNIEVNIN